MATRLGLDVFLDEHLDLVDGKRVALVACPSSVDQDLRSSVERLHRHSAVNLVALFGPEHGLRGDAQAGVHVTMYTDPQTQLPVHSLYGETRTPATDMLAGIDTLIIDLQDGGVRFYTFLATALYVMDAAAKAGCAALILDRPAPITGNRIEGPVLDPAYASFVGPYPMPIRYGMTIGEIAQMINAEHAVGCDLTVIPMEAWSRDMWFNETGLPFVPSSPNLPTLDAMTLYPGACLIEGTNISEGRGATKPFEYIGAPWIDAEFIAEHMNDLGLHGVRFRPVYFVPTFSKYRGELCAGVHVYVTDRERFEPVAMILHLLQTVMNAYPDEFAWREPWAENAHFPIDLLSGGTALREHLDAKRPVDALIESWREKSAAFAGIRDKYLLYFG